MIVLSRIKFKLVAGMNNNKIVEPFIIWWKVIQFMALKENTIYLSFVFLWKGFYGGFDFSIKFFIVFGFKLFLYIMIHSICFIFIRKRKNFFQNLIDLFYFIFIETREFLQLRIISRKSTMTFLQGRCNFFIFKSFLEKKLIQRRSFKLYFW